MNNHTEKEVVQNPIYSGLDVMKLVCAFLIVYTHTYNHDFGEIGEWVHANLSPVGVPFFFIASGYLYGKGLQKSGYSKAYLLHYLKRVLGMYVFWSVLTLPVAWINISIAHSDYGVLMKVIYIVRCFFFTGSLGIYWYVLALIYNSILMFYAHKWGRCSLLFFFSLIFFIVGVLYNGGGLRETFLGTFIHVVVGSERNALNVGLFYMCIGMLLWKRQSNVNQTLLWGLIVMSLVIKTFLNKITTYEIMQAPIAIVLFLIAIQNNWVNNWCLSLGMRKWSTAIYFGHFPFILLFDYYLKRGTIIDYPVSILFALALYYVIKKISPDRLTVIAYG